MHIVFLVHGIGVHEKGWSTGVQEFLKNTYRDHMGKDLKGSVTQFVEVTYDHVFTQILNRWAAEGKTLADFPQVKTLAPILSNMSKNDPLYTHIGDVVLFRLFEQVANDVMVSVLNQILVPWSKNRNASLSILAHSMGTSVIQRTLESINTHDLGGSFPPSKLNFANLMMVANVGRALTFPKHDDVYTSLTRPDWNSYTQHYWNIHHEMDVITLPWAFDPPPNGFVTPGCQYIDTKVNHFEQNPNVHDLLNYLKNPRVHLQLLLRISDLRWNPSFNDMIADYETSHTLQQVLQSALQAPLIASAKAAQGTEPQELHDILDLWYGYLHQLGVGK